MTATCLVLLGTAILNGAPTGEEIIEATGIQGGIVVHWGCGDGKLTAALGRNQGLVVHGLDASAAKVSAARQYVRSTGQYGRISIQQWSEPRLPYADNLVNLVVAEDLGSLPRTEVLRVLAPRGVLYTKQDGQWTTVVKPWPEDIDEWTHYLHGPDGNPVAHDRVVGPPKHYQWVSEPLWLRSHESDASIRTLVTARGRLFYIADEGPTSLLGDHALPDKWFLTARDAFNGTLLWKVPIQDWGWRAWKPSWFTPRPGDIPLNIQKRLVAEEDKVYVTLGYHAPVSQLDARTGETLTTYAGTEGTAEILLHERVLILTVLREDRAMVMAIDVPSGKRLWISQRDYAGTTTDYYRFRAMHGSVPPAKVEPTLNTATDGKIIALLDGADVVGLDFRDGKEKWRTPFPLVEADYRAGGIDARRTLWTGTLIVSGGVVLHASPNQLAGFSAQSGKVLWTQPKKYLQHLWYEWKDVFVIDPIVWTWSAELDRAQLAGGNQRSTWPTCVNGYDLQTGQLRKQVPLGNIFRTHHHHRCYRNKATIRYILASRRGTEFVDLQQGKHTVHNWVRGTCHLGMMPANGLQYAPPHPCVCYRDEKLNGLNALAPARRSEADEPRPKPDERLVPGPAYQEAPGSSAAGAGPSDWPTFRHDSLRSGSVNTKVPSKPRVIWQKHVGRKVAPPVVADGRLFAPRVDEHQLVALDAANGETLWEYTTGGRIDSPPTYYRGTVIFGSADGWVYCLRADDGALVWRFHAAPQDRHIAAFGQLESAWPVHGSVLVVRGTAYFASGRSSHLDGGIDLYGVDAASGQIRHHSSLTGPDYDVENITQNYQLPMGALPDILCGNEEWISMRDLAFRLDLQRRVVPARARMRRLRVPSGFLDDSYFKRTPWSFGAKNAYARLIVHDAQAAFYVRMFDTLRALDPTVFFTPGKQGYLLFATDRETGAELWKKRVPVRVNSMVATDDLLFLAGSPDLVDPKDPLGAFEGRKGGILGGVDRARGNAVWSHPLASPTVFDGLVAAAGRLFVVTQDGRLACFGM